MFFFKKLCSFVLGVTCKQFDSLQFNFFFLRWNQSIVQSSAGFFTLLRQNPSEYAICCPLWDFSIWLVEIGIICWLQMISMLVPSNSSGCFLSHLPWKARRALCLALEPFFVQVSTLLLCSGNSKLHLLNSGRPLLPSCICWNLPAGTELGQGQDSSPLFLTS